MTPTTGYALAWLKLTGENLDAAQVDFKPGLNVLWGASDTGKTFILSCIDFMLGALTPPKPIPELMGYTTAYLGIKDRTGKQRVFERSLKGGDFVVYDAEGADWTFANPQNLRCKHDANRTDTISHLLLSIVGIESACILTKQKGDTRTISYRDVARFTLIHEQRIIAEQTPVYPTGQRDAKTPELATFTFLISGSDWSGVVAAPDIKIEKASWRGKDEVYEQLVAELQQEIGENPPTLQTIADRIAVCDGQIAEITSKIEESTNAIAVMMGNRKAAWEDTQQAKSRLLVVGQLQDRFELLKSHYNSDLARLKFISEGDYYLAQLGAPSCPFCGELLEEHTLSRLEEEQTDLSSIQESAKEEAKKIAANVNDLDKTITAIAEEQQALDQHVSQRQQTINSAESTIRQNLEPQLGSEKQVLTELVETRTKLNAQQIAMMRLAHLAARRAALGDEPKQRRGEGTVSAYPNDSSLRMFSNEIAAVLTSWRYQGVGVVEFNDEMDMVVGGVPRITHGKGYRALLHSAFTIALMQHCDKTNLKHPGTIILDSPLTSFKEKDRPEVEEDIQIGFYESLLSLPDHEQVIILENKEPPTTLQPRMHHVHFSGNPHIGRKGFIPPRRPTNADPA